MLEVEGRRLCQSAAITRYLAKKFNLAGSDDWESALCDEYVDTVREIMQGSVQTNNFHDGFNYQLLIINYNFPYSTNAGFLRARTHQEGSLGQGINCKSGAQIAKI